MKKVFLVFVFFVLVTGNAEEQDKLSLDLPEIYVTAKDLSKQFQQGRLELFYAKEGLSHPKKDIISNIKPDPVPELNYLNLLQNKSCSQLIAEAAFADHLLISFLNADLLYEVPYNLDLSYGASKYIYQGERKTNFAIGFSAALYKSDLEYWYPQIILASKELADSRMNYFDFSSAIRRDFFGQNKEVGIDLSLLNVNGYAGNADDRFIGYKMYTDFSDIKLFGLTYLSASLEGLNSKIQNNIGTRVQFKTNKDDNWHVGFSFWNTNLALDCAVKNKFEDSAAMISELEINSKRSFLKAEDILNQDYIEISAMDPQFALIGVKAKKESVIKEKDINVNLLAECNLYNNYQVLRDDDNDGYFNYSSIGDTIVVKVGAIAEYEITSNLNIKGQVYLPWYSQKVYNQFDKLVELECSYVIDQNYLWKANLGYNLPEFGKLNLEKEGYLDLNTALEYHFDGNLLGFIKLQNLLSVGKAIYIGHNKADGLLSFGINVKF